MIFTEDGSDLVICDDKRCGAITEAATAEIQGWAMTRLTGPHYCPYGVALRFHTAIRREFGAWPT
ncbi:MAG: hypothetical protein GEV11_15685 [Streptosporangiales bacterium]|nr:hypothetical protein [Streptosporangiales bacterium]